MRAPYIALPLLLGLLAAGGARAAGVTVELDHSTRVALHGGAANVVVGNSAIADVAVIDSHTLYVTGHSLGSTDLAVIDALGRTIYSGEVTVARPVSSVTLYRGVDRQDFSCGGPTCEALARADANGASKEQQAPSTGVAGASAPPPHP